MKKQKQNLHSPVLLDEVVQVLQPQEGDTYLDLTAGYGGHSGRILACTQNYDSSVLCDRDIEAVEFNMSMYDGKIRVLHEDFLSACKSLSAENATFDMILADLGVSSPHLDKANRGFSVSKEGPLDMRMDQSSGMTVAELIDSLSVQELERILRVYGEEPKAKRIAQAIVEARPITTTLQLAECVKSVYRVHTKHHPAIRTFQALRIAVNDELTQLTSMLPIAFSLLNSSGRMAIITFHSLEDRIVKSFISDIAEMGYESEVDAYSKRPIIASHTESSLNPRARSAKLRYVVKK